MVLWCKKSFRAVTGLGVLTLECEFDVEFRVQPVNHIMTSRSLDPHRYELKVPAFKNRSCSEERGKKLVRHNGKITLIRMRVNNVIKKSISVKVIMTQEHSENYLYVREGRYPIIANPTDTIPNRDLKGLHRLKSRFKSVEAHS